MKRITAFLLCIISIFCFSSCKGNPQETGSSGDSASVVQQSSDIPEDITFSVAANGFDEAFFKFIEKRTDGNFMISPLSFRYALGLLLAGADGETKNELLKALNVESTDEWTCICKKFNTFTESFYKQLDKDIETHNRRVKQGYIDKGTPAPKRALSVANSVWKREDIKADFTAEYKKYVSENYGAQYYGFNENNAVKKINGWVNEKTEKLIPKLLDDNYNTKDLAVVLMNALYYKNNWINNFQKACTKDGDFNTDDGKTVKKQFMEQTENYDYYSDKNTQMVILPMAGGVNMAFVLGDASNIADKLSKTRSKRTYVKIPKMDIETSLNNMELISFLKENGVKDAFNPKKADFSKMIEDQIWVDDIVQKTRIKTDEEGVEAAAVTAIMTENAAYPMKDEPVEFIADRPFSFYIYAACEDTTAILFAGKVVN